MKPLNLKDLPGYLKTLKENKSFDENLVVDMGHVTSSQNIYKKFVLPVVFCLFLSFTIFSLYKANNNESTIIVLDTNSENISDILSEIDGEIISIKQNKELLYELKLKIKNADSLVDKLRKNKNIKKVELKAINKNL